MSGFSRVFLAKRSFNTDLFRTANMSDVTDAKQRGCDTGTLLDGFGVLIQGLLAVVAFSTLMLKRLREPAEVRRSWKIWFFDTSKQAVGALFVHFANVFLSMLTSEDACSLYLMNFLLDATLGMLVIWMGVHVVSRVVQYKQLTLLTFGEYGDPPKASAWCGQCVVYLLIMVLEKSVVTLVLLIPGWTNLQEVLLDYIPNPQLELVLVMLIVPFAVNFLMFWVVDSLIMRKYKTSKAVAAAAPEDSVKPGLPWVTSEESQVLIQDGPEDQNADENFNPVNKCAIPGCVEV
ncbi:transmembrane protein 110, like [Denticeps clupeoides]|uniref:Uncharacterized protein n=1 Tax=Denticeps clupeoides TaxID=299321 RepID=A0AAY4E132_9TELE|nr:store-operated calcium entry regulator STIMATE-like [Denticeps clupeoides]